MLPYPNIDPIAVRIGFLTIHWYSLAYIAGLFLGFFTIKGELSRLLGDKKEHVFDFLTDSMLGVIIGGRLGYCLFYNPSYYLFNPLECFFIWKGGMSFHGGAIGAAIAVLLFAKRHAISRWRVLDLLALSSTVGIALGRIANFINAELYGRITHVSWAFIFPGSDGMPRHPSQLYESLGEGVLLGLFLWWLNAKRLANGIIFSYFLIGYGVIRFMIEFTREPDAHIGLLLGISRGQLLCGIMILLGVLCRNWIRMRTLSSQ